MLTSIFHFYGEPLIGNNTRDHFYRNAYGISELKIKKKKDYSNSFILANQKKKKKEKNLSLNGSNC